MVGIVLLGIFVLLLAFGAPIAVCLGMSSVGAILVQGAGKPLDAIMSVLPRLCSSASSKFVLLAIPFFILSGNVMEKAGISGRLINLAEKCLGHIRGGMAMVCVVVSCFFAAISGSGPATVAALGLIMIPALKKAGYSPAFACALMAAGGAIGVVIPPSITFVVYGSIADASITDLFKAGVIPGLLMGLGLIVAALIVGRKANLIVFVDNNNLQLDGTCDEIMPNGDLGEKFRAFGWEVLELDGHSMEEITASIDKCYASQNGKPKCLYAHTVKGKGVSFMENQCGWHGVAPNDEQYKQAMAELEAQLIH